MRFRLGRLSWCQGTDGMDGRREIRASATAGCIAREGDFATCRGKKGEVTEEGGILSNERWYMCSAKERNAESDERRGKKNRHPPPPSCRNDVRVMTRDVLLTLLTVRSVPHRNFPPSPALCWTHPDVLTRHRMQLVRMRMRVRLRLLLLEIRRM